jgi:hypothetical protein
LPAITFPVAPAVSIWTPSDPLPEMTFRAAAVVPPIVLLAVPMIRMPSEPFPRSAVPFRLTPM